MKYLSECDVLIYDLHSGNPRDVDLALAGKISYISLITLIALKKYNFEEEKVLILISSLMVWNNTPPHLKEVKEGKEGEEEEAPREGEESKREDEGEKPDDRRSEGS